MNDPKPERRIRDVEALRAARISGDECAACHHSAGSVHHVIPKGERGDDVRGNLLLLCGDGTSGCHGAEHGNPYTITVLSGFRLSDFRIERRDAEWVHRRIGEFIAEFRPDVIAYVFGKLGPEAGEAYLERRYYLADAGAALAALSG